MKVTYLRATAALAVGLVLSACGGKASFDVSGTVYTNNVPGLPNSGLVLTNGSDTVTVPAGTPTFTFPQRISYGTDYDVEVKTSAAHMTCVAIQPTNAGSAGHTTSIQVSITCSQNSYTLGGTATGLVGTDPVGTGLVLANGSAGGTVAVGKPADGSGRADFVLPIPVEDGQVYGVTVYTQPNGLFCTVANGTDIMHNASVSNVIVTCKPQ